MMLIESNKESRVSLNSRSGTSSYTITPSTGIKPFMNPPSVAGGNQLSTIVHTNRGGGLGLGGLDIMRTETGYTQKSMEHLRKPVITNP